MAKKGSKKAPSEKEAHSQHDSDEEMGSWMTTTGSFIKNELPAVSAGFVALGYQSATLALGDHAPRVSFAGRDEEQPDEQEEASKSTGDRGLARMHWLD